jgi:hypothetical protein
MTQRASESLVAVLIRVGLLLALAIMLMAENAQAQPPQAHPPALSISAGSQHFRTDKPTSFSLRVRAGGTRTHRTA